ncbi:MAG: proline--tRNA ligase [Candidatus Heimdallarchaeota archaeon]|nr:proline--tRNA ligase [Candidatus Heimdallarchaeota archaeon]MCK4954069.1 proline--tRNA ligase [Candidatus Heimdallarchaeota archaeon]
MSIFTKKKENFMAWYLDVVRRAQIVDTRTEVKGMNVLLANGYEIWDRMKKMLDEKFYVTDHKNMYFPLFIPDKFLELESEHFEGFVPEVAYVTHAGKKKLENKFALRPTSETIMYHMYSQWIRAHTDMPLKVNQWCNIIRIDTKDTKPLLRDREFQWTEAHTCHVTPEEAVEQVKESMWIYGSFFDECCLPYLITKRPKYDTFPGALYSVAYDTPLPDGKTLQIGTTHNLDQGFAKVFNIRFQKEDGSHDYAYQTCYGLSTRVIAAVISVHGDNRGLIIPPYLAPLQVIIVPILFKGKEEGINKECEEVLKEIKKSDIRVEYDSSNKTSGFKFNEYELLGVPIRIEIGPKDVEKGGVTLARRDTKERIFVEKSKIVKAIKEAFDIITEELKNRSKTLLEKSITEVVAYDELESTFTDRNPGFVKTNWCGDEECADLIKEKLRAEIRGTLYGEEEEPFGPCIICNEEAKEVVYISRSY